MRSTLLGRAGPRPFTTCKQGRSVPRSVPRDRVQLKESVLQIRSDSVLGLESLLITGTPEAEMVQFQRLGAGSQASGSVLPRSHLEPDLYPTLGGRHQGTASPGVDSAVSWRITSTMVLTYC